MKHIIILFFIFSSIQLSSQELITRELKVLDLDLTIEKPNDITEVVVQKVKYHPDGSIKKLYQIKEGYKTNDPNNLHDSDFLEYEIIEDYKKDKRWFIYNIIYTHTKEINRKGETIIKSESFIHGKFQIFNENGTISYSSNYTMDKKDEIWYKYEYYPNGKIKLILEMKNKQPWNVIDYRFPDGQKFENYGDFKNGEGIIAFLNDKGEPCLDCTFTDKHKTIADWKCEE